MTIMFVLRKIARAKATSWRSPALKDPPWLIGISRVKLSFSELRFNRLMRWHLSRTSQHSRSVCSSNGSKLLRIVPENKETSWLTIVCRETQHKHVGKSTFNIPTIRVRRSSRPMVEMSIPSILMLNQLSIVRSLSEVQRTQFYRHSVRPFVIKRGPTWIYLPKPDEPSNDT